EVILALALARPVERQRRDAAREEWLLVGVGLLLAGIEAAGEEQHRRALDARGLAPDAGEPLAFIRRLDAFAAWTQIGQRELAAFDRLHVRGLHLSQVLHEQELTEVIVDAGALEVIAGAEKLPSRERLTAHLLMDGGARRPGAAPIVP